MQSEVDAISRSRSNDEQASDRESQYTAQSHPTQSPNATTCAGQATKKNTVVVEIEVEFRTESKDERLKDQGYPMVSNPSKFISPVQSSPVDSPVGRRRSGTKNGVGRTRVERSGREGEAGAGKKKKKGEKQEVDLESVHSSQFSADSRNSQPATRVLGVKVYASHGYGASRRTETNPKSKIEPRATSQEARGQTADYSSRVPKPNATSKTKTASKQASQRAASGRQNNHEPIERNEQKHEREKEKSEAEKRSNQTRKQ